MKAFLNKIRTPEKSASPQRQIMTTAGIMLFGFALGVLQKWLDGSPGHPFPLAGEPSAG